MNYPLPATVSAAFTTEFPAAFPEAAVGDPIPGPQPQPQPVPATGASAVRQPTWIYPSEWTLADLSAYLGDIPAERIALTPPPGYATEDDLLELLEGENRLFELIDGVLVEKAVGHYQSNLTVHLITALQNFLYEHPLGLLYAPDAPMRMRPGRVRYPDVAFVSHARLAAAGDRSGGILPAVPELAVEVLSPSNRTGEMRIKLADYFAGGTQLAWIIHPAKRTAAIYTPQADMTIIDTSGALDGRDVLPGFSLSLGELFARADQALGR